MCKVWIKSLIDYIIPLFLISTKCGECSWRYSQTQVMDTYTLPCLLTVTSLKLMVMLLLFRKITFFNLSKHQMFCTVLLGDSDCILPKEIFLQSTVFTAIRSKSFIHSSSSSNHLLRSMVSKGKILSLYKVIKKKWEQTKSTV